MPRWFPKCAGGFPAVLTGSQLVSQVVLQFGRLGKPTGRPTEDERQRKPPGTITWGETVLGDLGERPGDHKEIWKTFVDSVCGLRRRLGETIWETIWAMGKPSDLANHLGDLGDCQRNLESNWEPVSQLRRWSGPIPLTVSQVS